MTELMKIKNLSYSGYEEMLLRREKLRKEAFQYEQAYIREFGDLILEVFRMKIECIRKKKIIEYCQAALNHGHPVDQYRLQEHLRKEMESFEEQLDKMEADNENARNGRPVSEADMLKIRRIYRRLVKQIHPDINPLTKEIPELYVLWQRLQTAYKCNAVKEMEELEFLVNAALERTGAGRFGIDIPDIDGKIEKLREEIREIRETDPYQYKYILEDTEKTEEKKNCLKEELKSYKEYSEKLDEILDGLMADGVRFIWQMN